MGIFYETYEKSERGKHYIVIKRKTLPTYVLLALILVISIDQFVYIITKRLVIGKNIDIICIILFLIFITYGGIEQHRTYTRDSVIIKKGNSLSFSNPQEIWIEKNNLKQH